MDGHEGRAGASTNSSSAHIDGSIHLPIAGPAHNPLRTNNKKSSSSSTVLSLCNQHSHRESFVSFPDAVAAAAAAWPRGTQQLGKAATADALQSVSLHLSKRPGCLTCIAWPYLCVDCCCCCCCRFPNRIYSHHQTDIRTRSRCKGESEK